MNKIINELIPADDLHWDEHENRLCVLSDEDTEDVLLVSVNNCDLDPTDDFDKIMSIVRWVENTKTNQILLKEFLKGNIVVSGVNTNNEVCFMRKDEFDERNRVI